MKRLNKVELFLNYGDELKHIEIDLNETYKEIERLNENNQAMQEEMTRTWKKLDEKEKIIKEVRELLKNDYFEDGSFNSYKKLFELLDGDSNVS